MLSSHTAFQSQRLCKSDFRAAKYFGEVYARGYAILCQLHANCRFCVPVPPLVQVAFLFILNLCKRIIYSNWCAIISTCRRPGRLWFLTPSGTNITRNDSNEQPSGRRNIVEKLPTEWNASIAERVHGCVRIWRCDVLSSLHGSDRVVSYIHKFKTGANIY